MAERDIALLVGAGDSSDFSDENLDYGEFAAMDGDAENVENPLPGVEEQRQFVRDQQPENTTRKTKYDVAFLHSWLAESGEQRDIAKIPPRDLDVLLGHFFMTIKKKDGHEYEPDSLSAFQARFDRYLRSQAYEYSLYNSREFCNSREVIGAKRNKLKKQGLGNRKNKATPFSPEELEVLKTKRLLGLSNPQALMNTLYLNNCMYFGMRSGADHRDLLLGDIEIKREPSGLEYLEFTERATKTRNGEHRGPDSVRKFLPKAFANDEDPNSCPVFAYKSFLSHRPPAKNAPECKFYLTVNHKPKAGSVCWFKDCPMGINKLASLMKDMATKAGFESRKVNHSGRKTCVTTLLHAGVHPTMIQQLTGHTNVQSINDYAEASVDQQKGMSRALCNVM